MITLSSEDISLTINLLGVFFFAVLFLQSGINKVADWQGNLSWLTEHIESSPLSNIVPLLLGIITISELATGGICAYGVVEILFFDQSTIAILGVLLSAVNIVILFTGQRLAKDYPGAAVLAGYFLSAIVLLNFTA